jgi:hypothetical protein
MGGAMSKAGAEVNETGKGSRREEITISDDEIKATMCEIFGPDGGERFRDAPWELLRQGVYHAMFKSMALMLKVFHVELKRGNLGVIKLMLELIDRIAKRGPVEPEVMQSFADLLIKSLEAESLEAEGLEAEGLAKEAPVEVPGDGCERWVSRGGPGSEDPDVGHPGEAGDPDSAVVCLDV